MTNLISLTLYLTWNVEFKGINLLENQNIREGIKKFSDWTTIPQLYIQGEFIGGSDIVKELFEKGELKKLLESKKEEFMKDRIGKTKDNDEFLLTMNG